MPTAGDPIPPRSVDAVEDSTTAIGDLIARAYPALRGMAAARAHASGRAISPSSIVQEAVCRILRSPQRPASTEAIEGLAWRMMEWIVIDRVRADGARRRREAGAGAPEQPADEQGTEPDALMRAISALAEQDPRKAEVLTLSALCGLPLQQVADLVGVNVRTAHRDLAFARSWVAARLGQADAVTPNQHESG